jgi:ribosome-binding factor A
MQQRVERVAALVQQNVGKNLHKHFPQSLLTITEVNVSPDLKHADVWVSQLQQSQAGQAATLEAIEAVRDELQHELAESMKTKFTPKLRFKLDTGTNHAQRIDELLDQL